MNPRRERFKQAMSRFEPTGDPAQALKQGLYVNQPGQSIAARIFATLELRPQSSHLLAGPSGVGKTTQLRLLEDHLEKSEEFKPVFVDASAKGSDVSRSGQLMARINAVAQALKYERLSQEALGLTLFVDVLRALSKDGTSSPDLLRKASDLRLQIATAKRKPVLLLDSLDRLPLERFRDICEGDLAKLRGILAIVVVAPPAVMYGAARELVDQFDQLLRQPTYDPSRGGVGHRFLTQILRQRAGDDLISDESCTMLVSASGGLLRDLIALAQLALEEAYVVGRDRVEPDDVRRAVDTFGRKHIVGLDSREIELLRRLHKTGKFVRVTDGDASLLITRRILEYADERGTPHFAIHPTLIPLLDHVGDL